MPLADALPVLPRPGPGGTASIQRRGRRQSQSAFRQSRWRPWLAGCRTPTAISMSALLPPPSLPQPDENQCTCSHQNWKSGRFRAGRELSLTRTERWSPSTRGAVDLGELRRDLARCEPLGVRQDNLIHPVSRRWRFLTICGSKVSARSWVRRSGPGRWPRSAPSSPGSRSGRPRSHCRTGRFPPGPGAQ
jgi:hypothetical protein